MEFIHSLIHSVTEIKIRWFVPENVSFWNQIYPRADFSNQSSVSLSNKLNREIKSESEWMKTQFYISNWDWRICPQNMNLLIWSFGSQLEFHLPFRIWLGLWLWHWEKAQSWYQWYFQSLILIFMVFLILNPEVNGISNLWSRCSHDFLVSVGDDQRQNGQVSGWPESTLASW
jgi:hypothetical protein